ncbi:hypothetical protein [Geoalkalibacter sp.]|uniref:hypothetical protein n=1 Tax=Geoalkalibacter sp. TaxID=3041440 RepID=UPI00272E6209|nr:hypothetical protein [Geoalkalibacter sp.]
MGLPITEQEEELITYFRGMTAFNQQRLLTIAGIAYENRRRTLALQEPIPARRKA